MQEHRCNVRDMERIIGERGEVTPNRNGTQRNDEKQLSPISQCGCPCFDDQR